MHGNGTREREREKEVFLERYGLEYCSEPKESCHLVFLWGKKISAQSLTDPNRILLIRISLL